MDHPKTSTSWMSVLPLSTWAFPDPVVSDPPSVIEVFPLKLLDIARAPGGERGGAVAEG